MRLSALLGTVIFLGLWDLQLLFLLILWKVKGIVASVTSNSLRPHGLQPTRLLCPWNSPGKNTGVNCHTFLQGLFPTQGSSPHLLHHLHWQVLFPLVPCGKPLIFCILKSGSIPQHIHWSVLCCIYWRITWKWTFSLHLSPIWCSALWSLADLASLES